MSFSGVAVDCGRQDDDLPGFELADLVDLGDDFGGHARGLAYFSQAVVFADFIFLPARVKAAFGRIKEGHSVGFARRGHINGHGAGGRGHRAQKSRVIRRKLLPGDAQGGGKAEEVYSAANFNGHQGDALGIIRRGEAQKAQVVHDSDDRHQLGHILGGFILEAGFAAEHVVFVRKRENVVRAAGSVKGLHDFAFARVISGDGERPVVEKAVEFEQIISRRVSGLIGVAAFIHPPVALKAEVFAGLGHELPDAGGPGGGYGIGVKAAFHNGEIGDVRGQAFFGKDFLHKRQISLRAAQILGEKLIAPPHKKLKLQKDVLFGFARQGNKEVRLVLKGLNFLRRQGRAVIRRRIGQRVHGRGLGIFFVGLVFAGSLLAVFRRAGGHQQNQHEREQPQGGVFKRRAASWLVGKEGGMFHALSGFWFSRAERVG